MIEKIGVPALWLCAMMAPIPPARANAARVGVVVGGPVYAGQAYQTCPPAPLVCDNAYPEYPVYLYPAPVYVYPYRYIPYVRFRVSRGRREHVRREWREGHMRR